MAPVNWPLKKRSDVEPYTHKAKGHTRRGYIPVMVGVERYLVNVRLLKDPRMATLLEMAANELGYRQEGILGIPCDHLQQFWRVVDVVSKAR